MSLNEFLQLRLFELLGQEVLVRNILFALAGLVVLSITYYILVHRLLPSYFRYEKVITRNRGAVKASLFYILLVLLLLWWVITLNFDFTLYHNERFNFRISTLLKAFLIFQFARLADWIISKVLLYNYYRSRKKIDQEGPLTIKEAPPKVGKTAGRAVQYTVYVVALILVLQSFNLDYVFIDRAQFRLTLSSLFIIVLLVLLARLVAWVLTQLILYSYYQKEGVEKGSRFAINQILKYVIYIIALFMILESLHIKMTVIWGGAAALLVGLGLGLQHIFNDLFSGVLLLFERTVEVADIIEVDGLVGTVRKIGLRTSLVETRENVAVIVPNSKLVSDKVINWSHGDDKVRFQIAVAVVYGSDTQLVKKLLLEAAAKNIYVLDHPAPTVRFIGFGDSSLDFRLLFWSRNFIVIEDIKSDLRFDIDAFFRENGVTIPFPQRDVWMRKGYTSEE